MRSADDVLQAQYLDMRGKILSLAADFDRIERAGPLPMSPQLEKLREAMRLALEGREARRAEKVQLLLSDPLAE